MSKRRAPADKGPDHEWVEPYIQRVIEHLGLQAWTWNLAHQSGLSVQHGTRTDHNVDATCATDWRYLDATITIDSQTWIGIFAQPSMEPKLLLCHEVCHILLAQLGKAMEQIINVYFPDEDDTPSDQSTAMTIYSDHEEHTITRLCRRVYEAIEREDALQAQVDSLRYQLRLLSEESK